MPIAPAAAMNVLARTVMRRKVGSAPSIAAHVREITRDPVAQHEGTYVGKYRQMIVDLGYDNQRFAKEYSTEIHIVPRRARLW